MQVVSSNGHSINASFCDLSMNITNPRKAFDDILRKLLGSNYGF